MTLLKKKFVQFGRVSLRKEIEFGKMSYMYIYIYIHMNRALKSAEVIGGTVYATLLIRSSRYRLPGEVPLLHVMTNI
jgi:hypothetical protein